MESWGLLRQDLKVRVLYNLLKALLGFLSVVVASEYVSRALTSTLSVSPAIHYGEALSIFILGAVALREGSRWLMGFLLTEASGHPRQPERGPEPPAQRA
jgi:hypothetical protein